MEGGGSREGGGRVWRATENYGLERTEDQNLQGELQMLLVRESTLYRRSLNENWTQKYESK